MNFLKILCCGRNNTFLTRLQRSPGWAGRRALHQPCVAADAGSTFWRNSCSLGRSFIQLSGMRSTTCKWGESRLAAVQFCAVCKNICSYHLQWCDSEFSPGWSQFSPVLMLWAHGWEYWYEILAFSTLQPMICLESSFSSWASWNKFEQFPSDHLFCFLISY